LFEGSGGLIDDKTKFALLIVEQVSWSDVSDTNLNICADKDILPHSDILVHYLWILDENNSIIIWWL